MHKGYMVLLLAVEWELVPIMGILPGPLFRPRPGPPGQVQVDSGGGVWFSVPLSRCHQNQKVLKIFVKEKKEPIR